MSKRTSFATLVGEKKEAEADSSERTQLPPATVFMHTIVGNPDNPRRDGESQAGDPAFEELVAAMKEVGQLQPVAVVSRDVYLRHKPEHAKAVSAADWVVITGNRRLAAARELGWTRIDIKVQDHLGDGEGFLDEAVIIENIHRKAIEPCKEAVFLQRMVTKYGSQDKVAQRIGKSQMYVSQRLALLRLSPELQLRVDAGLFKVKAARQIAASTEDHAEQWTRYQQIQEAEQQPKPERKPALAEAESKADMSTPAAPLPEQRGEQPKVAKESSPRRRSEAAGEPAPFAQLRLALDEAATPEILVEGLQALTDGAYRQRLAELLMEQM